MRTLAVVLAGGIGWAVLPAGAATSGSVVSAQVPSATNMSITGCLPGVAGRTAFGLVPVATSVSTTDDCTVTFGSSNDTASLRMAQLDASGKALSAAPDRRQVSWGSNGISTLGISSFGTVGAEATVLQPDGKTVGIGCDYSSGERSAMYRLNADGSLDTTFNAPNGFVTMDIAVGQADCFLDGAIQPDGKIVAVGRVRTGGTDSNGTVARVNADGTVDTAFGGGGTGWRVDDLGGPNNNEAYSAVLVNADGTIVAGGNDDVAGIDDRWVFGQYLVNGTPDPSIGAGTGRTSVNPTVNQDQLASLAHHPFGGYAAGGQAQPSTLLGAVGRLTPSLTIDATWGASGYRMLDVVSYYETIVEIEPLADGSLVLAVEHTAGAANYGIVAKLTPGGALDTAGFAAPDGFLLLPTVTAADRTKSIEITATGLIYVLYEQLSAGSRLARVTAAGAMDVTFDGDGVTALDSAVSVGAMRSLHLIGNTLQFTTRNSAVTNDRTVRYGGPEIDDYVDAGAGTDRDWSSGLGNSMFGVCLREQLVATADWAVDPGNDCDVTDADEWRGIPALTTDPQSLVAHTTVAGQAATTRLRFGFRTSANQAAGGYEAPVLFEVVAPS